VAPDSKPVSKSEPIPTKERLARDIEALANANHDPELMPMIRRARAGYYDDYESSLAIPCMQLVGDFRKLGYEGMARKAINGMWDGTKAESEAWAKRQTDPEIRAVLAFFLKGEGVADA